MVQFKKLILLAMVLLAQQQQHIFAQTQDEEPFEYPTVAGSPCPPKPNAKDTGDARGRYQENPVGVPVYRFREPEQDVDIVGEYKQFVKTRFLGPIEAVLKSPFDKDPRESALDVIGYATPDGGISREPLPDTTPSPTRRTRSPATPKPTRATKSPTPPTFRPTKSPTRKVKRGAKGRLLREGEELEEESEEETQEDIEDEIDNSDDLTENEIAEALDEHQRRLNIFLPDDREEINQNLYPYRAVGKWRGCTATLVYRPGIVVTNAHCLAYKDDGTMDPAMWSRSFMAAFKNNAFLASSTPKAIWYNKNLDYAVLKLHNNIDSIVGRFGAYFRAKSFFSTARPLRMVSYSGDHCPNLANCRPKLAKGKSRGVYSNSENVKHDLDATRGSSGSAMWAWYVVNGKSVPVMDALNWGENRNGGDVSLTFASYTGNNPNLAKPGWVWFAGYLKVAPY